MEITATKILIFSSLLLMFGLIGVLRHRDNLLQMLMSVELIYLAISTNFVGMAAFLHNISLQVVVIFVVILAVIKAVIGVAIISVLFKNKQLALDSMHKLRG